MPHPRGSAQLRCTEQTPALKAVSEVGGPQGDKSSVAPPPLASIVWVKTPHVSAKDEWLHRTGQVHAEISPIASPSRNGRHATWWACARSTTATVKSAGASSGHSAPLRSSLAVEKSREETAGVSSAPRPVRARSADPYQCPSSPTAGRVASLKLFSDSPTRRNGASEPPHAPHRRARSSNPASAGVRPCTSPSARAHPHPLQTSDAMFTASQSRAVCARPARDAPSFHTSSSSVLHPSGAECLRVATMHPGHPRGAAAPAHLIKKDAWNKERCASPPQSSSSTPACRRVARRHTDESAALDKPWLAAPPAHGILKRRGRKNNTHVAPSTVSAIGPSLFAHRVHSPSGAPKAGIGDPNASSFSNLESVSPPNSSKQARHVAFDEAAIKYLDASASNLEYDHSQLGTHPASVEWGTAMLSSYAAGDFDGGRPPTGTAGSIGKASADSWGADSEWFNEDFGAQLTPAAATADSATASLSPTAAAVPIESTPFSSSALITRQSRGSLPFSSTSLSSSTLMPATASTAARGTTRHVGVPGREREAREAGDCQALDTSASPPTCGSPHSTPVLMNTHLACVLSGAAIPASSSSVGTSDASGDYSRGLSPVLTYENASFDTSTHSGNDNVVPSSRSSNTFSQALPLSLADLRRRYPPEAPSLATSVALPDRSGVSGRRHGGSHRRLLSPSVYLSNLEVSLTELAGSGQSAQSATQEAAPVPPTTRILATNSDDRESPTIGAMKLSVGERRLLRAVMQVNERKRLADLNAAPSVIPSRMNTSPSSIVTVETPSRTLSSRAGSNLSSTSILPSRATANDEGALYGTTQAPDDPHAKVLSAEARQSLDVGAPSVSSTTTSRSRVGRPSAEDVAGSADSNMRARVVGAQLSSRSISAASQTPFSATGGTPGNPGSTAIPSAETTSGGLSPSFPPSSRSVLPAAKASDAQASRRDATFTAAPAALSSETPRLGTFPSRPRSHGVDMPATQWAHRQLDDWDEDEDESEPHIQVPEPTPRIPTGKLQWEAQRR